MQTIKDYSWIIRHINNAGHFFFYNAIVRFMEGREANIRTLLPIWSIFKQWFERENEIYKRSSKAIETKAVETALKERRTAYVALRRGIRSALYSDDESVRKSGARLMEVSDNFKNIYHAPMTEASSLVHGMLKDLKEERYLPHIIALGLEQYVARLKRANED
jgi:hypothetical protein